MLRRAALVNPLARRFGLWHRHFMQKTENKSREERLADALRANLRRRKANTSDSGRANADRPSSPKSVD
jgi:hypothetical protein